ncbi:MAG: sulfite exporter TauE/SafE family protein [Enterococcus sp.]
MVGVVYFTVIVLANAIGAISGMGGGILIKPLFDLIGIHSVSEVSFYSTTAVFTMALVSTMRHLASGKKFAWPIVIWVSLGAVLGGILGNVVFDSLLSFFEKAEQVTLVQILLTIVTLLFAFCYTRYEWPHFHFRTKGMYLICGLILGFFASLLGIGGGPINVSLLMLLFSLPIKESTMYSIGIIFFSQLAKLTTIAVTIGFGQYDLGILFYVIPAAAIGGLLGARLSSVLPAEKVTFVFQTVILLVLGINLYNGLNILI